MNRRLHYTEFRKDVSGMKNYRPIEIVNIANNLFSSAYVDKNIDWGSQNARIDILDIYNGAFYPEHEYDLRMENDLGMAGDKKILGKTIPSEMVILIDKSINPSKNDSRFSFTLAHEIGHAVLHRDCLKENLFLTTEYSLPINNLIEKQANLFASNLLIPRSILETKLRKLLRLDRTRRIIYYGPDIYYFDDDYSFDTHALQIHSLKHYYMTMAKFLRPFFSNCSKECLTYAIKNVNVICNKTYENI
jgi:hypothetical protein